MLDGLRAGIGAPALDADACRVGTRTGSGTGAFFAGLDADDRLVGTRGGDDGAGSSTGGRGNTGAGSSVGAGTVAGDDGAGLDGAIVFGRAGNLIVAASGIARAIAAAIAGVGAIEVGRGGRLLCE